MDKDEMQKKLRASNAGSADEEVESLQRSLAEMSAVCERAIADVAVLNAKLDARVPLTHEELKVALSNVGIDITCDHCAEVFWTGSSNHNHAGRCETDSCDGLDGFVHYPGRIWDGP
jgi:hypothetical protein